MYQTQTRCSITSENGMLVLTSPYIHALVEAVKSLPYTERRYDGSRKVWLVDPKHGQTLSSWVNMYAGEVVSLPSVSAAKAGPVMKLLEVRYIGACKQKDDGSSVAFGLVGSEWAVMFPETVLRSWFDNGVTEDPTEAQTLYQMLGTAKTASVDEVRSAYRRMARQWHPDVCREPNAADVFIRIQEAYQILSDANKRARYDAGLALQKAFDDQQKALNKAVKACAAKTAYRSPLRCGMLLVEGTQKLGRIEVSKILAWEDITRNGKTLITSWPMGKDAPVEVWT